jgi:hypothetical protein
MTGHDSLDDVRQDHDQTRALDAAARDAHAASLEHVSARVQAQLQQRRRATLSNRRNVVRPLWPALALGGAAAIALVVGLRIARDPTDTPAPSVATTSNDTEATQAPAPVVASHGNDTSNDTNDGPNSDRATQDVIAHDASNDTANAATNDMSVASTDSTADTTMQELDRWLADEFDASTLDDNTLLAANAEMLAADFEENPDLYLWLGSDESLADDSTEFL